MIRTISAFVGATFVMSIGASLNAQEKSVAPEINKAFRKPDIADFQGKFEKEGREAFEHREAIVKACNIREGMQVADVGADIPVRISTLTLGSSGESVVGRSAVLEVHRSG